MNARIATRLTRVVIDVLRGNPPLVPRQNEPLPSVLKARKRDVKVENWRYIKWRHRRGLDHKHSDQVEEALIRLNHRRELRIGYYEMMRRMEREARR